MDSINLNVDEFNDDQLLLGVDENDKVIELARSYCASLKKFEPLSKDEEKKLFEEYNQNHNPTIKKEIIERHLRFVVWYINKHNIKVRGMDFMDLVQEGNYLLLKIFDKFDASYGYRFITFLGESLEEYFYSFILENSHFMRIGHNMHSKYLKYSKYREDYIKEHGRSPSKEEVIHQFHIRNSTYEAFKNMDNVGNTAISLDKSISDSTEDFSYYDLVPFDIDMFSISENLIDNKFLLWGIREILTPFEYYLLYNYIFNSDNFTQNKIAASFGIHQTSISHHLKDILAKIKTFDFHKLKYPKDIINKIDKIDLRPTDFPKKVILIYMRNKLSEDEFYYVYNAWFLKYDEEILRRKFKRAGMNYDELKTSMQSIIENLDEMLNFKYKVILKRVMRKYSIPQIFALDISANLDFDYQMSRILNNMTYDQVIDKLGSNYASLEEQQKESLYSYYNSKYKWKNTHIKEDIEAKINLNRHGFKRKRNIGKDKLYQVYIKNLDMFEDNTREVLEGSLFSSYTHKKIKLNSTKKSAYYRSLWRLEEKYYNLDNYFSFDIPKREYYRILKEYNYIFTTEELWVLNKHSEYKKKRLTFEEIGKLLGKSPNEVDGIYTWAKNKILLLYLGLYNVMVIDNEPLYVKYINDPKFNITPLARKIGELRFIEHLSYEEIANLVNFEDDNKVLNKKSQTSKKQKVSNIITKLVRAIEIHHYEILNELNVNDNNIILLLDKLSYEEIDRNIIKDFYIEKVTMDELKSKYNMSQPGINAIIMKFKYNYISHYKKEVHRDNIIAELNEHVTDTVLTDDQRIILAFMEGIKCPDNILGEKKDAKEIAEILKKSEKNIMTIYRKGLSSLGAKLAGIIGSDLGRLSRTEVIKALEDKNIPLSKEEKILIRQFKGIDSETKSLEELGKMHGVNAASIKRRIQNIYLSILKYQNEETNSKPIFEKDIVPVLKYIPLYYQNIIIDIYRDNLNNKEIALKYGINYERIHIEIGDAKKNLYYILKCPLARKFDFDYARKVINNPDIPYYDDETKDVVYIFNRLFGNDGKKPASKKEIQEALGLSNNIKLRTILRKMMIAICKYRDGFRKTRSYKKEEIEEFYNTYKDELSDFHKKHFLHALRDNSQVYKGVSDYVLYSMLKKETDDILFLDKLSEEETKDLIRKNPYHLTSSQLEYLAFENHISGKELISGRKRRKLYRALVPFLKDFILEEIQKKKISNKL